MITPTYRAEAGWEARHISELTKRLRQWQARRGFEAPYQWVVELTKAGKPHYHLLVALPEGMKLPKPDDQGWWPHGSTRIERAKRSAGYLAKYVSKGTGGHAIPAGARLYGSGGLAKAGRVERRWWLLPRWARDASGGEPCDLTRAKGGGVVNRTTGELYLSPWRVVYLGGKLHLVPNSFTEGTASQEAPGATISPRPIPEVPPKTEVLYAL